MLIGNVDSVDYDRLTEIWEGAVRATHDFLTEDDILYYKEQVRNVYLYAVDLLAVRNEEGVILGFMGMSPPCKVEMLFVDPALRRKGIGSALIRHAAGALGYLEVDVNEQNPSGIRFYEKCGFILTGRSEHDAQGRPFPLLHMRLGLSMVK